MTERSRDELEKMFTEIMGSLTEYSTEEINNPESAKAKIIKLLKSYRAVKRCDYQYGLSIKLKKDHRLIIKEPEDGSKVREYAKSKNYFCCIRLGCTSKSIKVVCGILFAPIKHHDKCEAREYSFVMEVQNLLKQGKAKEAYGLSIHHGKQSQNNNSSQSPSSTSMLNESTLSGADDHIDCSTAERVLSYDELFEFDRPSTYILKRLCKKLEIDYCNIAYKFWGDIAFQNIPDISSNILTHSIKSPNFFACLSLFFTGKPDTCFLIQHVINKAFREDPHIQDTISDEEIDKIIINSNTLYDEQIKFIASFLSCRIGLYYDGRLKKFGKWDHAEEDVLTLILSFDSGLFSVVLDIE